MKGIVTNALILSAMYFYATPRGWTVHAPAKLNLFFEVHGKRSDGYHEISSLALPIRLFDTMLFEVDEKEDIDFRCFGGDEDIPNDATNIVVRALELLRRKTGTTRGARVRLLKRIPSQAGLGGGSGDAAAAMSIANRAWKLGLSRAELSGLAAEIGSDCPIFFQRGASLSRGRGERIEAVGPIPRLHFVVLKPKDGLSTAAVYARCMEQHDGRMHDLREVLDPLQRGDAAGAGRKFFNRLEAAARTVWPRWDEVMRHWTGLDCLAVRMSGSGSAFYGLCRHARHARHVAGTLRQRLRDGEQVFEIAGL